ncbi:MAG: RagB/SusD family nutrient uptake outer membrane protein, partial [Tannerella sp.]|nr:RagB/SusD family nutrient uptake outer membrane protein [Tannerella sp.]
MEKYKFIIIAGMSVFALMQSSCNDDFLERAPITSLSDADFWKSENDLKIYCNNFYNQDGLLP